MKSFQTISIPLLWWTTNQDGGRENKSRRLLTNHSLFYLVLYVRSLPLKVCEDGQLVLFLTLESVCFSTVDTKERERDKQSLGWTFSKGCSSVAVKSGNFISFNFIWVEINWICSPPSNDIYVYIFFFKLIWFSARALFGHFPQNCSQNEKLDISQGWATTQGRFRFVIVIDFLSFDQFKWHAFRRTLIAVKENYIVLEQFSHYMKVTFPLSSDGNTR